LNSDSLATLALTTAENGALIRGSTEPGANVILIPDNGLLMRYSETVANEWGLFAFGAVAPGTYRVVSWFDVPPCAIWDPNAGIACARVGEVVTAKESGTATVTVRP
jgi:hypothetical protein